MASSPTSRSLDYCRKQGWTCQVVEKWIPQAKRRIDLFGCIDVVALDGNPLGIQACAGSSHAARRAKAIAEPRLQLWLDAGCRFEVWSWTKKGKAGKRKLWTLRREAVTLADLNGGAAE